jgi:predicted regulator of Ras-like GTPase activity (Roadblock/LC7/MglB family)
MDTVLSLGIREVARLDEILQNYLTKSESDLAVIIDQGGNVISQCGHSEVMDVTIIAALAAGSFAATKELAKRIGEIEFNAVYHQGNGNHIFMNSVDDDTIMITVFGSQTTVGLVRFYATGCCKALAEFLIVIRAQGAGDMNFSGFDVNSLDVTAHR